MCVCVCGCGCGCGCVHVYVAYYWFLCMQDLPFDKGDRLTIVSKTDVSCVHCNIRMYACAYVCMCVLRVQYPSI